MKKTNFINLLSFAILAMGVASCNAANKQQSSESSTNTPTVSESTDSSTVKESSSETQTESSTVTESSSESSPEESSSSVVEHVHSPAEAVQENVVAPSCEEAGSHDEVIYCSDPECHEEISRQTITDPATGHKYVKHDAVAPTYLLEGANEYYTCEGCTKLFTKVGEEYNEITAESIGVDKLSSALYSVNDLGEHQVDAAVLKTSTGIKIEYLAAEDANSFGYGACLDLPGTDKSVLLATTGNIAFQDYGNWLWFYELPSTVGATVERKQVGDLMYSSFEFNFETLGISESTGEIGVLLYEVVNANGAQYGIYNTDENIAIDGGVANFKQAALLEFVKHAAVNPTALTEGCKEYYTKAGSDTIYANVNHNYVETTLEALKIEKLSSLYSVNGLGEHQVNAAIRKTETGFIFEFLGAEDTNSFGYGACLDLPGTDKSVLLATTGNIAFQDYGNWAWAYELPSTVGATVERKQVGSLTYSSFEFTDSTLGITEGADSFGVLLYEVVNANGAQYGIYNTVENIAIDGGVANFKQVALLPTTTFEQFGKSNANVRVIANGQGIKIVINSDGGIFGYGVMLSNAGKTAGTTDLYALGYGTIDHKIYNDWNWAGNYIAPSSVGLTASEVTEGGKTTITLFYSWETLNNDSYNLGITSDSETIGIQFFEYVMDATGELYGCYNCIRVDGTMVAFDTGVENFVAVPLK